MAGYLGNSPADSSVRIARQIYTTSGVTTDFTFTSGYDPGYIDVYVNGERQTEGTNFTANDGSTVIILNGGVSTGSTVECAAYKTFNVATVTLGEVTDVDDLTITGALVSGSGDIGIATIHSSGIDAGVGVITAASFVGDGSSLTGVASTDNIITGTAATFTNQVAIDNLSVTGVTTTGIATVSTSIVVGSAVTVTATAININPTVTTTIGDSGNVDFSDDAKARFGTGNDLSIYHSGSHSFINDSGTGNLKILSSQVDILNPASNETIATFAENGAVSLYHDNTKRLETLVIGGKVTGELQVTGDANVAGVCTVGTAITMGDDVKAYFGAGGDLQIYHNSTSNNSHIDESGSGSLVIKATNTYINSATDEGMIAAIADGAVELYYDAAKRLETTSSGAKVYKNGEAQLVINGVVNGAGGYLVLQNTDTTDNNYMMIQNIDANGQGTGDIKFTNVSHTNNEGQIEFRTRPSGGSTTTALTLDSSQNATFAGSVTDSKGDVRKIPLNNQTSAYVPVVADSGKVITISTGGITINTGVMLVGDVITIINNSGSDQTITQGSGFTMYNSADASTGNRTLAGRGMATLWYGAQDWGYISGAGLS